MSFAVVRYLAIATVFTVFWLNLHWVAIAFEIAPGASVWYPARGLSLALLLVFGLRYAPVLFIASLIGGIPFHLPDHPQNLVASAGLITGVMTATAWLLQRLGMRTAMRLRDAVHLIVVAAAGAWLTAHAVVAVNLASGLLQAQDYWEMGFRFFVGDYLGVLIVVPLALLLAAGLSRLAAEGWPGWPEDVALARASGEALLIVAIAAALLWLGVAEAASAYTVTTQGRWYLLLLPLALAAIRFGPPGAAVATLGLSVAVIGVLRASGNPIDQIDLQVLLLAFAIASLLLSAAVGDRRRSLAELARLHHLQAQRAQREAEQARASKARFLAATTHDLRPPFEAVRLGLETLRQQQLPLEAVTVLDRAASAAHSLARVMDSVLDTSRLEGELRHVAPRVVALRPLLERVAAETAHQHPRGRDAVHVCPSSAQVVVDPVLIERLLRNLTANAVRASAPEGRVLLGVRWQAPVARVEVHDTGPGIMAERLPTIFRDFVSDDAGGTGIGLSLVREIADELGLRLQARSTVGAGSVFSIELPLAAGAVARRGSLEPYVTRVRDRVLVLALAARARREMLAAVLSDWGAAVIPAEDADRARHELRASGGVADVWVVDEPLARLPVVRGHAPAVVVQLGGERRPLSADLAAIVSRLR